MEPREHGFESQLYVNTGTYGSPVWTLIDLARDITDLRDHADLDATTRGTAMLGVKASQSGITPRGFEFDCLVPAGGETNSAYSALMTACKARSNVDLLHVDGGAIGTDGLAAERIVCQLSGGGKGEPLNDMSTRSFRAQFTPNSDQTTGPEEGTVSGGAFVAAS